MTLPERINLIRRYGIDVSDDGFFATPDGPVHIDGSKLGRALLAHDDLLAACKAVLRDIYADGWPRCCEDIRSAIDKAEGGEA